MHPALYVEEILRNIFSYVPSYLPHLVPMTPVFRSPNDILSLATTCKAFKEPALDILWARLQDLSPLVRCLPEESWVNVDSKGIYSLNRRLKQADWDIILGYARRVQALHGLCGSCVLAVGCLEALSRPPSPTVSIFPKLREVGLTMPWKEVSRFVRQLSGPRLTKLYLSHPENLGNAIHAFGKGCPNMRDFTVFGSANPDTISSIICHWPNLYNANCALANLNVAALSHLSRLHNLQYLDFRLDEEVADLIQSSQSRTSSTFPALWNFHMVSKSLASGRKFFHHFRLPVIYELFYFLCVTPTVLELVSFFAALQESCGHNTLIRFNLIREDSFDFESSSSVSETDEDLPPYYMTFDHLCPLTVFSNAQVINVSLGCGVDLNERELLCLASSWPHLKHFSLCSPHWTASSGITPGGFVQLLERCRSLKSLNVMFDTRGYTEVPEGHPWGGLTMSKGFGASLHLQSSPIEEESVNALAVFFHVAPFPDFRLDTYWSDPSLHNGRVSKKLCRVYRDRWVKVRSLARSLWEERTA